MHLARQPSAARPNRIIGSVRWLGLLLVISVGCSTRVPFEPEKVFKPDAQGVDRTSKPRPDAAAGTVDNEDAAQTQNAVTDHGSDTTSTDQTASDDTVVVSDTQNAMSVPSTTTALDTTSSADSAQTTVTPPIPTRQLTVPLPEAAVKFAIVVSVDGLATRFLEQQINAGLAPSFAKLQQIAAWTHNARTDKTHTYTLPNHTCMLTGLPVHPVPGLETYRAHFYTSNVDPAPDATLHQLRFPEHTYTYSMFDVAHDNGLATAMFASKTKFSLFSQSYNDEGARDTVGVDNGKKKIDKVVLNVDPQAMVGEFVRQLQMLPPHLTFVHLNQPDGAGHSYGWGSPAYLAAVSAMDTLLGQILKTIQQGQLRDRTALIVTSDHGGVDYSHLDPEVAFNYRIPFYVLAPGVPPGDLYDSLEHRVAPGEDNPGYDALEQPLRNGDAGNLALDLLGLAPIPDSVVHSAGILTSL